MQFRILYIRNEELRDRFIDFDESISVDRRYLRSLYEDFNYNCRKSEVQLVAMIPIIEGEPSTECYITCAFRYFKDFDLVVWLTEVFNNYEIIFRNDRFHRFKGRKK